MKKVPPVVKPWVQQTTQGSGLSGSLAGERLAALFQTAVPLYIAMVRQDSCSKLVNFRDDFARRKFVFKKTNLVRGGNH